MTQKQPPSIGGESPKLKIRVSTKLIVGIFLTIAGILLTLENFGVPYADRILAWWPVVLIAIGVFKWQDRHARGPAVVALVAGSLLLLFNTGLLGFSIFDFWPVALIIGGAVIVAHAFGLRLPAPSGGSGSTTWAVFGSRKEIVDQKNYTGGRVITIVGGCVLDLTAADMPQGSAVLEIVSIWGGVEVKVPEGWDVTGNTTPIMGGADIKVKPRHGDRKLIVNGLAIMGGISIKSVATEAI
jgi:predicted membrane protein